MHTAETRYATTETGPATDDLLRVLDSPDAGLRSMKLQDVRYTEGLPLAYQAVAFDLNQVDPLKSARSERYQSRSNLLAIARTPNDRLYGVVATRTVIEGSGEQVGFVISEIAEQGDESATVLGKARYADEKPLIICEPEVNPRWALSVGLCEDGGATQIALIHAGIGATALYRADPSASTSFRDDVLLPPQMWCPPARELAEALYS